MQKSSLPIGVFDSGVGGITVLAEMVRILPNEGFYYFGDSLNAPYGTKSTEVVKNLTIEAVQYLANKGIKALVVACNTATSAAIHELREKFAFPVLGMEPALKPAVKLCPTRKIVVMATPLTLREKKFQYLLSEFHDAADILPLACPGLVELIEDGEFHGDKIKGYLEDLFSGIHLSEVGAIVLGCTHYLYIKDVIKDLVGNSIAILDGNYGTAKHLANILITHGISAPEQNENKNQVEFFTTDQRKEIIQKYRYFFEYALKNIYPESNNY